MKNSLPPYDSSAWNGDHNVPYGTAWANAMRTYVDNVMTFLLDLAQALGATMIDRVEELGR